MGELNFCKNKSPGRQNVGMRVGQDILSPLRSVNTERVSVLGGLKEGWRHGPGQGTAAGVSRHAKGKGRLL